MHPRDRPPGGATDRVPADREFQHPGPQPAADAGRAARIQGRLRRAAPDCQAVQGRNPVRLRHARHLRRGRGRAPGRVRTPLGAWRPELRAGVQRPGAGPHGQRPGRGVCAPQDPRRRARPEDGRTAVPQGPRHRHQADLRRQRLPRHLQLAACEPGGPARGAHHPHPGRRHPLRRRHAARAGRHRLCHRLRRRHRGLRPDCLPWSRRPRAKSTLGRRTAHLPRADERGLPEPVHADRAAKSVDPDQRGHGHRAACGAGDALPGRPATPRREPDRAHRRGRDGLGCARGRSGRAHAARQRELLVHRRQRARQAARVPALHRRAGRLHPALRRCRRRRLARLRD